MRLLVALAVVLVALVGVALAGYRLLPSWYAESVPPPVGRQVYPLEHVATIREAATRHGVDPALVAAVIFQESSFRENVVSESGAVGLMQVLPSTAGDIARRTGGTRFEPGDLHDPEINIRYGTELLRFLLEYYDGDVPTALAAYHAGPGNVDSWLRDAGSDELELAAIPFTDTRAYVERVGRLRTIYRRIWGDELGDAG